MSLALGIYLRVLAAFYLIGAAAHGVNILSLGGRTWALTPLHWRVLDVSYLLLDVAAAAGLILRQPWGVALFLLGAGSQIVLYLGFPQFFSETESELRNLRSLVAFHFATIGIYFLLFFLNDRKWV